MRVIDTKALRALYARATPGEWTVYNPKPPRPGNSVFHKNRTVCAPAGFSMALMAVAYCDYMTPEYAEGNAAAIAGIHNAAPELLDAYDEVAALRGRLRAAEEVVEAARHMMKLDPLTMAPVKVCLWYELSGKCLHALSAYDEGAKVAEMSIAEQCAEIAERHGYDDAAGAIRSAFPAKES